MKTLPLAAAAGLLLVTAACDKGDKSAASNEMTPVTAAPVPAPNNGDWSEVVAATPEGGFVMGNPNAKVKLVEYGSMSCPHCAEFDEKGVKPLIDNYVKNGLVSYELRNFVRDGFDMTATLIARCGGPSSFFGLTRAFYGDQQNWMGKLQENAAQLEAMQSLNPQQQFAKIAEITGFIDFAAMRGLPRAKAEACLADPAAVNKLVQMSSDATAQYNIPGTPSFLINGELVEQAATWDALEPKLRDALGG